MGGPVSADDVVKEIANQLKGRKGLDPAVVNTVISALLDTDNPIGSVDALDSQLYTIAMRRTEKK
jgi:hypothetical protein